MIKPGEKVVIPSQDRNLVADRASPFAAGLHGSTPIHSVSRFWSSRVDPGYSGRSRRLSLRAFFFLGPIIVGHFPRLVGVKGIHRLKGLQGIWSEILLKNDAIGPDHERFHSGHAIFRWRGRKAEPAKHCASDDEICFTSGCSRTLLFQHFEIVTTIRFALVGIALFESFGHVFANRAAPGSIRIFPSQTM